MWKFLLIATVLYTHATLSAGIFSWKDASGNIVYGDAPPETVAAKPVAPPKLTILENFANRYDDKNALTKSANASGSGMRKTKSTWGAKRSQDKNPYTSLNIIAPKAGQSIRANDGDVSIALSMSPKLKGGDKVIIYLNGEQHSSIRSRVTNLSNLDRGEYTLSVEIKSADGETLLKSAQQSFNVLRNSVINNKTKPYNPYDDDPSQ